MCPIRRGWCCLWKLHRYRPLPFEIFRYLRKFDITKLIFPRIWSIKFIKNCSKMPLCLKSRIGGCQYDQCYDWRVHALPKGCKNRRISADRGYQNQKKIFLRKYNKKNGWYVNWESLLDENEVICPCCRRLCGYLGYGRSGKRQRHERSVL